MAERRMFNKKITDSDAFLDMPMSTQCLYFHLNMAADDDGFVNSPKTIQRKIGASADDMRILVSKRFILVFESGVIVIKHWKMHNYIRSDRYKPTDYIEEKSTLALDGKSAYTELVDALDTNGIPTVSVGKDRLGKDRINNIFVPPSVEEVREYCKERKNKVDAEMFIDFYESKGWMVGKNKMKDWKACVRTWEKSKGETKKQNNNFNNFHQRDYDFDDLENKLFGK